MTDPKNTAQAEPDHSLATALASCKLLGFVTAETAAQPGQYVAKAGAAKAGSGKLGVSKSGITKLGATKGGSPPPA